MYSYEIKNLLKLKNYVINDKDFMNILKTSPQINHQKYDKERDLFLIDTDDHYHAEFKVKIKTR